MSRNTILKIQAKTSANRCKVLRTSTPLWWSTSRKVAFGRSYLKKKKKTSTNPYFSLSDSQKQSLDTCPIANVKLLLSNTKSTKNSSPKQIVNRIKKRWIAFKIDVLKEKFRVLARTDSRGIFGKELDDPTPPQPIMTIVDHLRMKGFDQEGIFRLVQARL